MGQAQNSQSFLKLSDGARGHGLVLSRRPIRSRTLYVSLGHAVGTYLRMRAKPEHVKHADDGDANKNIGHPESSRFSTGQF